MHALLHSAENAKENIHKAKCRSCLPPRDAAYHKMSFACDCISIWLVFDGSDLVLSGPALRGPEGSPPTIWTVLSLSLSLSYSY